MIRQIPRKPRSTHSSTNALQRTHTSNQSRTHTDLSKTTTGGPPFSMKTPRNSFFSPRRTDESNQEHAPIYLKPRRASVGPPVSKKTPRYSVFPKCSTKNTYKQSRKRTRPSEATTTTVLPSGSLRWSASSPRKLRRTHSSQKRSTKNTSKRPRTRNHRKKRKK